MKADEKDCIDILLNERKEYNSSTIIKNQLNERNIKIAISFIELNADRIAYECYLSNSSVEKVAKKEILKVFPKLDINEKLLKKYLYKHMIIPEFVVELLYSFIIFILLITSSILIGQYSLSLIIPLLLVSFSLVCFILDPTFNLIRLYYKIIFYIKRKRL